MQVFKTQFICLKQDVAISILNVFKIIDYFLSLGSNISSTKINVNISIGKPYTAVDRLSIIWKSNVYD